MDISVPSPISAQATLAAQAPLREPPSVSIVDPSTAAETARNDTNTGNGEGQTDTASIAQQQLQRQEWLEDPKTPTGPPPSFQVTLLEVEQDLQNILARLELARSKDRDAEALRPDPDAAAADSNSMTLAPAGGDDIAIADATPMATMPAPAKEPSEALVENPLDLQISTQSEISMANDGMPL